MDAPRATAWPHALLALLVSALLLPGLSFRHLWNDEVDTAERARSVLHTGLPRITDPEGRLSVNTGGREVEDSDLHRYSPWLQFHVAAMGLALADATGVSRDAGVRFPFVLLHGAASGVASHALVASAGMATAPALLVGAALGLQGVRMVFNRQARYPALEEFLLVVGLAAVGRWRRRGSPGLSLGMCVALLPHTHPLGGTAMAGMLLGVSGLASLSLADPRTARTVLLPWARHALLPLLTGLVLLAALTRPWGQGAWGEPGTTGFRSLSHSSFTWMLVFAALSALLLLAARARTAAASLVAWMAMLVTGVAVLDLHPLSASRYYFPAVLLFMLWPVALGLAEHGRSAVMAYTLGAVLFATGPDLQRAALGAGHLGVRLVMADAQHAADGARQPLHIMLDHVRAHGVPGDPVLVDIVPQFVNWYLPGHPVALVPDAADRTARNAQHPMWNTPLQMPRWHIFFPLQPTGFWTCMGHCDVKVEPQHPGRPDSPYDLVSGRLGARARYCPVMGIPTSRLINAPYEYLATGITDPAGLPSTILVLAERCDAPGEKKTTP